MRNNSGKKYLREIKKTLPAGNKPMMRAVSCFMILCFLAQEIIFAYSPALFFISQPVKKIGQPLADDLFFVQKIYAKTTGLSAKLPIGTSTGTTQGTGRSPNIVPATGPKPHADNSTGSSGAGATTGGARITYSVQPGSGSPPASPTPATPGALAGTPQPTAAAAAIARANPANPNSSSASSAAGTRTNIAAASPSGSSAPTAARTTSVAATTTTGSPVPASRTSAVNSSLPPSTSPAATGPVEDRESPRAEMAAATNARPQAPSRVPADRVPAIDTPDRVTATLSEGGNAISPAHRPGRTVAAAELQASLELERLQARTATTPEPPQTRSPQGSQRLARLPAAEPLARLPEVNVRPLGVIMPEVRTPSPSLAVRELAADRRTLPVISRQSSTFGLAQIRPNWQTDNHLVSTKPLFINPWKTKSNIFKPAVMPVILIKQNTSALPAMPQIKIEPVKFAKLTQLPTKPVIIVRTSTPKIEPVKFIKPQILPQPVYANAMQTNMPKIAPIKFANTTRLPNLLPVIKAQAQLPRIMPVYNRLQVSKLEAIKIPKLTQLPKFSDQVFKPAYIPKIAVNKFNQPVQLPKFNTQTVQPRRAKIEPIKFIKPETLPQIAMPRFKPFNPAPAVKKSHQFIELPKLTPTYQGFIKQKNIMPIAYKPMKLPKLNPPAFRPISAPARQAAFFKPQELPTIAMFQLISRNRALSSGAIGTPNFISLKINSLAYNKSTQLPRPAKFIQRLPVNRESFVKLPAIKQLDMIFEPGRINGQAKQISLVDTYMQQLRTARFAWHKAHNEFIVLSRLIEAAAENQAPAELTEASRVAGAKENLDRKTREVIEQFGEAVVIQLVSEKAQASEEASTVIVITGLPDRQLPVSLPVRDAALPVEPFGGPDEPLMPVLGDSAKRSGFLDSLREMFKQNLLLALVATPANTNPVVPEVDSGAMVRLRGRSSFSGEHAGGIR